MQIYEEARSTLFPEEAKEGETPKYEVAVLVDGFGGFQKKFKVSLIFSDSPQTRADGSVACRTTPSWSRTLTKPTGTVNGAEGPLLWMAPLFYKDISNYTNQFLQVLLSWSTSTPPKVSCCSTANATGSSVLTELSTFTAFNWMPSSFWLRLRSMLGGIGAM